MRIRTIKPEFWRSTDISRLPISARLTFIGLWSYVDDNGVGWLHLPAIAADLFADDLVADPRDTLARLSRDMQTLFDNLLLVSYTTPEAPGRELFYVRTWEKHQRIDRPSKGHQYPLPPAEILTPRDTLATPSRHPRDTLAPGTGEQGNRGTGEQIHPHTPSGEGESVRALEASQTSDDEGAAAGQQPDDDDTAGADTTTAPKPKPKPADGFDEFWDTYPRRVGKRAAAKAWKTATQRANTQTILTATHHYANDPNLPEPRYIPHPATWLNRDGWNDDPQPPRNQPTNHHQPTTADNLRAWGGTGNPTPPPHLWEIA